MLIIIQPLIVNSSIPDPIKVPTSIPGNLPANNKKTNKPVGMEDIPDNRHNASSGKKGNKKIRKRLTTYFLSKIDSYLSYTVLPTALITSGFPYFLASKNAINDPRKIELILRREPHKIPKRLPPIIVVILPGMGEIIT